MARVQLHKLLALSALVAAALSTSACTAVSVASAGAKVVGTSVGLGVHAVSSTGDVIFDHDGDGR